MLASLTHFALFVASVVLWVHLAADVLRFRDLQGIPEQSAAAWRRLLLTAIGLLLVLTLAAVVDSPAAFAALAYCIAVRVIAWSGLRLALRMGWHAQSKD